MNALPGPPGQHAHDSITRNRTLVASSLPGGGATVGARGLSAAMRSKLRATGAGLDLPAP